MRPPDGWNFCTRILAAATAWPDRVAIERVGQADLETLTYRDLAGEAERRGARLAASGIGTGDRVAFLADNSARWIAAYLGTLWIGAVAVPLDTAYSADQIATVVRDCGARILFTTARYLDRARAAVEAMPAATIARLDEDLAAGPEPGAAETTSPPGDGRAALDSHAAAVMLYTSGTTADPKGVVLTHANLDAERVAALAIVNASETDAVLGVLPLFHALAQMANLLLPLSVGARVVFLESVSSTSLLEALERRGITIFACVPQFFYLIHERVMTEVAHRGRVARILVRTLLAVNGWCRDHVGWNPGRRWFRRVHARLGPSMRILVTGGSKFDPAVARDLYALGFTILNAYGLTESSGGAAITRPGDRFTSSVGQALPGVEIAIGPTPTPVRGADDDAATDGEILIRGPIVMREYFGRADATRGAIDADGWLHTGDLGRLDAAGRLFITGRAKEIIVLASGKNLYPEEIEAHYRQSAFIQELCVMGLTRPDMPAAERLHAVIVPDEAALRARDIVNIGDLIRFEIETWSATLPAHKRILTYDIARAPLPRTTTGKLKRHEIERQARARAASTSRTAPVLNDADRSWMADPAHAPLVDSIAARLGRAVAPDENLELDLGLDSMERVETLTMLERRQGTVVAPSSRAAIFTVRQLVEAVLAGAARDTAHETTDESAWPAILATAPDADLARTLTPPTTAVSLGCHLAIRAIGRLARIVLRVRMTGVDRVPDTGACLISPNHQTFLDGFLVASILPFRVYRRIFFVGAAEFFETPMRRRFARLIGLVPIDPDAKLVRAMQAGAAGLRAGRVLMLFPEGERSIDGEVKRFRKGAAILSACLDVPIVPVALDGLFPIWPRGHGIAWHRLRPWRRQRVSITFGPPMRMSPGDYVDGTAQLQRAVVDLRVSDEA